MRFRWLRAQHGRNENLGHGYVNIGGNKSVEKFETPHPPAEKRQQRTGAAEKISQPRQQECPRFENHEAWGSRLWGSVYGKENLASPRSLPPIILNSLGGLSTTSTEDVCSHTRND